MQISGHTFDTRSSLRGSWTLWGWLSGRVELVMPLQSFHNNLTYAELCTITSFEALIKGMSSNRARKQQLKQRNKLFCSKLPLAHYGLSAFWLHLVFSVYQPPHHTPNNLFHYYFPYVWKKKKRKKKATKNVYPRSGAHSWWFIDNWYHSYTQNVMNYWTTNINFLWKFSMQIMLSKSRR